MTTSYPVNMPPARERFAALGFVHVTFGVWLGIYAFRAFVPTAVWNLSDTLPLYLKGALAIGVHLLGVAGCILLITRRPSSARILAFTVAALTVLRQLFVGDDVLGSALSLLGWIAWLWWFSAFARASARDGVTLGASLATAFTLQVGMQAFWHGLDLPMVRGLVAVFAAASIAGVFAATAPSNARAESAAAGGTRALATFGLAFFLELTLFANVGRVGAVTGLGLIAAVLTIQFGLLLGLLASTAPNRLLNFAALIVLIGATSLIMRAGALTIVLVIAAQAALVMLLVASEAHRARSITLPFLAGSIGLFVLVFLFYNRYEWPLLWVLAALLLALAALPFHAGLPAPHHKLALLAVAGFALSALAAAGETKQHESRRATATLRVLTYNIHQGFDDAGVPAMQRIANEIAGMDADVVALQEVGRGWTFVGGADLVAYLRYRFPDYRVHFVPVNGQLWGVALLSRLPFDELGGRAFEAPARDFKYGVAEGSVHIANVRVRVLSVHLNAGLEGNGADARVEQADHLLRATSGYRHAIIAGDLNTHPGEPPLQRIVGAGYVDAGVHTGLSTARTWPAVAPNERIDYVLVRGQLRPVTGLVKRTTASDHLPVLIELAVDADSART